MVELSPLDQALLKVQGDPDKFEAAYYELFLNSTIYSPTWDVPEQTGERTLDEDEAFEPVIIEAEDDVKYVMLFDSEERLAQWASESCDKEIGTIGLSGFDILNVFGKEFHMMLNVNSEQLKEFVPEEIEWLLSTTEIEEQ